MKASIEWLERGRIGIVRVGPRCARYSKPFDYSAVFHRSKFKPFKVEIKALVADGLLKPAHQKAAWCAVKRAFSLTPCDVFFRRFK
jgi:hypothetical protein